MVRFDKFTLKAQEAVQSAQDIAARHDHQQIEPLHLLGALVAQQDGIVPPLLQRLGVRPDTLANEIETRLGRIPKVTGAVQQQMSPAANKVLEARSSKPSNSRMNMFPPSTSFWPSPPFARMRPRNSWPSTEPRAKRSCRR